MRHLLLAVVLALAAFGNASIKCPTSSQCECIPYKTKEDESEVQCHRKEDNRSHILLVHVEARKNVVFQCNPTMHWTDFDLLAGMSVGSVESVMFSFCPMPNMPFIKFFQSLNISGVNSLTYHHSNVSNTLDRSQFAGLSNLTSLTLNSCGITGLPADIFLELSKLTSLDLRENNVVLPPHIFDHLTNLQVLELGSNNLSHLEKGVFQNLTNLRVLNLWSNRLQNLSKEVFVGLSNVEYIELSSNGLITLPSDVFAEMGKVKEVGLYGNKFVSLPKGLFSSMPFLRKLKLYDNRQQLKHLPSGLLSNLTHLQEVYLNKCELTSLPEDMFWGSTEIKTLALQENALKTLPEKLLKDCYKIETLDLSYSQLEELPDKVFANLTKLKDLKLGHNKLSNISKNLFKDMSELKKLDMEHNELQHVARQAFLYMKNLVHLQLSHNQLTMQSYPFQQSLLNNCVLLEELYLAYNNVTTIFGDWIQTLIKLRILDLSHNAIPFLQATDLHFLSTSVTVDLTYNNISVMYINDRNPPTVYFNTRNDFSKIHRRFLLEGNPVICDCLVYDLLRYIEGKQDPTVYDMYQLEPGNLTCVGPSGLGNRRVDTLRSATFECPIPGLNNCPEPCTCTTRPADGALRIYCYDKQLTRIPMLPTLNEVDSNGTLKRLKMGLNHTELLFSKNRIVKLPTSTNPGYENVTKMYLSHNNITMLSMENLPPIIQVLELHNNNLTYINDSVLEFLADESTGLKNLTLHQNPWKCDCVARGLLNFLQEHYTQVSYLSDVICSDGSGRALRNLTITEICPSSSTAIIAVCVTIALLGIIIGILAAVYYHYQREVKVWLFAHGWCLWFVTEEELDKDKLYDAFISYSHRDEEFVVNQLVPELERGPAPFKLCLHYRDWIAGEWIPNQIARSVDDSKRTLVVLSPNFLESVWGRMEFRTAHSQALSEGRARVIVLLYGDVGPLDQLDPELKAYLSMNTYVKWGDPWFWDKLRYALPHPFTGKKRGMELKPCKKAKDDKLELINPSTPPAATTPPTETIKNPLEAAKETPATNGHATLLTETNGHVNQCFVKSV